MSVRLSHPADSTPSKKKETDAVPGATKPLSRSPRYVPIRHRSLGDREPPTPIEVDKEPNTFLKGAARGERGAEPASGIHPGRLS